MNVRETATSVLRTAKDREITFLAAGFAYYAFVSVIPLVLLALVVGSIVGGQDLATRLVDAAGDALPAAGDELLTEALTTETGRAEATVVALGVAAWGGLKVFRGLSKAFDMVYGTDEEDSILDQVLEGLAVIAVVAAALALMTILGVVIGVFSGQIPFVGLLSWVVLIGGLFLVFVPLYYLLPPIDVTLRETLPGAAFAAVGWALLQVGFQLYAANAAQFEAYGAIGAVLLFVTWLYFAGILILLGAVLNVVVSRPSLAA
ncbi:YihY/virulence factor BrkB family protein [Natronobiforma cellulositropha]|uniref:YihY/virulence factor BrkB family protein n=1 Tax=Natronobiforma cellulositropha TaxID=1679076 RepID=UPI0021D5CAB1|nr:YihY/virulence factor BrkB family protein [Natronobiforma cellulositropha]